MGRGNISRIASGRALAVALVIPLQGSAGMYGPACELCARLAAEEINAAAGLLGREVELVVIDGGGPPSVVAAEVGSAVDRGAVDAVVGWHISAVRRAVAPRIAGRVPYVYTALYEGGERTPGVFLTGEVPSQQLLPAMRWLADEARVRRWCIVGDNYVWPRQSAVAARRYALDCRGRVVEEIYVPLGCKDFTAALRRVERSRCDGVLMFLVGQDAAAFNRAFAQVGLDVQCLRLSTLMDENMVLASGAESTRGLCAAAGYFEALPTAESLDFERRYVRRFGPDAPPLSSIGESCYEGLLLLAALARSARSFDVRAMYPRADGVSYQGARGELRVRRCHLPQPIYLARASGYELEVVAQLAAPLG